MRSRQLASVTLAVLLVMPVAACSQDSPPATDAVGTSELAPENNGGKPGGDRAKKRAAKAKETRGTSKAQQAKGKRDGTHARPATAETEAATSDDSDTAGDAATGDDSPAAQPKPSGARAAVPDPTGDVRGALTGAPPYADLTGAALTRGDDFEVRVSFAGAVPQRQTDDRIVQVATFYDLDGDGETDYEVWASLADNGWGTSYRTPDGARYGDDSGARARPDGNDLVITFPLTHLERAETTAWAVGAQWGTLEQVASGTTSRDNAPDGGWARLSS
jgi:hypothetical protein